MMAVSSSINAFESDYRYGADYWDGRIYKDTKLDINSENLNEFVIKIIKRFREDKSEIERETGFTFVSDPDNAVDVVEWNDKYEYFRFADLQEKNGDIKKGKVRVDINPCVDSMRHTTKVFVIPLVNFEASEAEICEATLNEFFAKAKEQAQRIIDLIATKYFSYLEEKAGEYYSIFGHISSICPKLGKNNESALILENTVNNIIDDRAVERNTVREFLWPLTKSAPFEKCPDVNKYKIFGQSLDELSSESTSKGLYGYYQHKGVSHILGVTTCYPHRVTREIMRDIINGT